MTHRTLLTAALVVGALAVPVRAETDIPLSHWAAPIYWSPGVPEREDVAGGRRAPRSVNDPLALPSAPLPFVAVPPCRVVDTRGGAPFTGGPFAAAESRDYQFSAAAAPCNTIPASAAAFSLNFTVTQTGGPGFLAAYPRGGRPVPLVSTINYAGGQTIANGAVVPGDASGFITVLAGVNGTHVIIDINGYYAGTGLVTSVTPGTGLSGGGTGDVVLGIAPSGVTSTELAANAVTSSKIAANAVTAGAIASNAAVKSLNTATGDLTLVGSGSVTVGTAGSTLTIGAPSGSFVLGAPGDSTLIGAGYTEVGASSIEYWSATATTGAPSARHAHTAVWTGTEMIIWGGIPTTNTGGRYNPATNSWTATSVGTNVPAARYFHTAVWTGTEMTVWGGWNGSTVLNTGGRYSPASNTWTATDAAFAPTARYSHTAVWTGTTMIVWGGIPYTNTGGIYSPSTNGWTNTSVGANVPSARFIHAAVWTSGLGTPVMVVWGGWDGSAYVNTGGRYNPGTNTWATMETASAPAARTAPAVWTGSRMIVWGGCDDSGTLGTGGQYDPVGNSWTSTSSVGAPSARENHTAVWTGSKMIVWGGSDGVNKVSSGGVYAPKGNDWAATSGVTAPAARFKHTAVWANGRMIVWGGWSVDDENTGGIYQFLSVFKKD